MANNFPTIIPSLNMQFAATGTLPPDVTFTRASQSGGYYDGVTVSKAEENLFLQSQALNTSPWSGANVTVQENTGDTTAPDGTSTANKFTAVAGLANHFRTQALSSVNGATYVSSVYVKQGTHDFIQIYISNGSGFANFDVGSGVVGTSGSVTSSSMIDDGDGWYRCIVVWVAAGTNNYPTLKIAETASDARAASWTALGTETLYVWGIQNEQRSSVTAYTPTTTQPITNYIPKMLFAPANVPVFDHNPITGEALGLSVWEARTNLLTYSEDFSNAAWSKTNTTISANQVIAPDGTLTVDRIIENVGTQIQFAVSRSLTISSGATLTLSVYLKRGTGTDRGFRLEIGGSTSGFRVNFNPDTGAVNSTSTTGTGTIISSGSVQVGNGWRRYFITGVAGTETSVQAYVPRFLSTATGSTIGYTGDGIQSFSIWGAQLEAGSFATPYIPTVASTVARSADVAVMTGVNFSRWFNNAEGTLVVKYKTGPGRNDACVFAIDDGTVSNRISLLTDISASTDGAIFAVSVGAVAQAFLSNGTPGLNEDGIFAGAYKVNDFASCRDGGTVQTDTSGNVPVVNRAAIGSTGVPTAISNASIKSIQYYPTRLTDAQLQAVTA